ncbi:transcriptional regulator YqjI [Variibacter gotjawalensis]|uniref:Transcriptional regulator YqjI n=1 Tax=Variibacter gotjawalensis TaxID=1333996 RepID=A0A0S3PPS2_9BRAD|nr:DNA-binding PadR family transcriptional regulator [Variibacter gotjawalensis]RZS50053.1 PadR family transcriptional regulator [Variibacter gotjawalensis]BAT57884.1 transcriptional regulator YqjI [Variibacter gotjawalensis]
MFGMHRGCGSERWASGRGWRGSRGFGGWGGKHGMGGGDMLRAGRMLATGDLKLLALALIEQQPRHGYDIIKVLEEKTAGWYSPSPGTVYPTLTFLEEAGYVTAEADGAKKLYTITPEGRAHLDENRAFVDAVLERLASVGEKAERVRKHFRGEERDAREAREDDDMPRSIRGAFEDLSRVVRDTLKSDPAAKTRVIEALDRAAEALKKQG